MPSTQVSVAFLVTLKPKDDKLDDVTNFLKAGYDLVKAEPDTIQWFAIKRTDRDAPPTFGIFDTFRDEAGREAHLKGKVAEALGANASTLLNVEPDIASLNVIGNKFTLTEGAGKTAGLKVGLRVFLTAKPDKVQVLREFLLEELALVQEEPRTPIWYALEYPGTHKFAVIDFFADEEGRNAHLASKAAEQLFANADVLLASPPDVAKFEVIAANVRV
ncbi:hypothetical protein B0H11DRAFT_2244557 [Mycena galericulata]|nr:hypothetical protein B0H11DRAFT_2244557 [Mycena galericulata]